ncbi:MAG: hypothetical protein JO319_11150 [Acidobacteriaceae bacterium]|nr:hypothetical protein [Acidobacteriaceae bacterium]
MTLRAIRTETAAWSSSEEPAWITEFLASLAREDLSTATLRGYRYDLLHFLAWQCSIQAGTARRG